MPAGLAPVLQGGPLFNPAVSNTGIQPPAQLDSFQGVFNTPVVTSGAAVTIGTANLISRNAPSGAITAAILAAGRYDGQIVIVTNESTVVANSITFSTVLATGLILTDATPDANVIKASSVSMFIWFQSLNAGNGAWIKFGPFGG